MGNVSGAFFTQDELEIKPEIMTLQLSLGQSLDRIAALLSTEQSPCKSPDFSPPSPCVSSSA